MPFACRGSVLRAVIAAFLFAAITHRAAAQDRPPEGDRRLREIRVRIACDEEFRRRPRWKSEAALRVTFASQVYEREFRIAWTVAEIVEWESDDAARSMDWLADEAEREVGPGGADVLVALTGQSRPAAQGDTYAQDGVAMAYGRAALCRAQRAAEPESSDTLTLCHELGHVLGAWHSADGTSVMSTGSSKRSLSFDDASRRAIELARDLDFARGVEWLGADRERQLVEIYRAASRGKPCWFPVAGGWSSWARDLASKAPAQAGEIASAYERSADLHAQAEEHEGRREARARVSASWWRDRAGDLDAAVVQAEKGAEVVRRDPSAEDAPGAAALRLAQLLDRRGDNARAAKIRTDVREMRGLPAEATVLPSLAVTRTRIEAGPDARIAMATWKEDGFTHKVAEIALGARTASRADAESFERPAPADVHFRTLAPEPLEGGWEPGQGFEGEIVAVAAGSRGRLEVEVIDGMRGVAAGDLAITRTAFDCDPESPAGLARLGVFLRRRPGAKSASASGWELLLVAGPAAGRESTTRIGIPLDGPADGALVRLASEPPGRAFLRVGAEPVALRTWKWYPKRGGSTSVEADVTTGAIRIDDRTVATDDDPATPGWRVVVRFVPSAAR